MTEPKSGQESGQTSNDPLAIAPRRLIVLRHAKSSWNDPGMNDFDRPLNDRGRRAAPYMGQRLKAANIQVDLVLASTAQRVRETLALLLPAWEGQVQVVWEKQLYLASVTTLLGHLAAMHDDWPTIMVVGHNPGLSELVGTMTGQAIDIPTAGIVMLEGPAMPWPTALRQRPWHQTHFWTPKDSP